jgi:hypothetical protein
VTQKPWREKTLVLCFYEYVGRWREQTRRFQDSVMIEVEFPDQIEGTFDRVMRDRHANWTVGRFSGYRPLEWYLKVAVQQTPKGLVAHRSFGDVG